MEEQKSAKKAAKRKLNRSANLSMAVSESEDSENEIIDYGNGNGIEDDDSQTSDDGWSSDDDRELVQKVKSTAKKENDKVNYKTRLNQVDWNGIAFKAYTPEECKSRFYSHLKNVRHWRTLSEIAIDIEANIKKCPLKKPLNSYQLFVQEQLANVKSSGDFSETMKNLASRYKNLPDEERAVYKSRAEKLSLEYKIKKGEYTGKVPKISKAATKALSKCKNPADLFVEKTGKTRDEYAKLSLDEKYKFITKAISIAPDEPLTKILSKDEINLLNGRAKTTPAAYNLYIKETYSQLKGKYDRKDLFSEVAQRWKTLDPKKKKGYIEAAALLKEKAILEQEQFNERHGLTPQKPQRRKSVYVEQPPEFSDHEDEEVEAEPVISSPKPKKRKTSVSSAFDELSSTERDRETTIKREQTTPVKLAPPTNFTVVHTPLKSMEKKRKNKLNSESEDFTGKEESDVASGSTTASAKKKSKKEKKTEIIEPPGDKPPSTLFSYFATQIHTGKPRKAQKAFDKLTKKERKQLTAEYNEKAENYVAHLKKYLASLSKEEAVAYISKIKAADDAEQRKIDAEQGHTSQEY